MASNSFAKTLQHINLFPAELKMEILSYLHIGIIVSLFEQPKSVILYCIKLERMDRNKSFSKMFQEFTVKELIDLIMLTDSINKTYIMRHFIDYKRRDFIKQKQQKIILQQQWIQFNNLHAGDYFMSTRNANYIIVSKSKITLKCIELGTDITEFSSATSATNATNATSSSPTSSSPIKSITYKTITKMSRIKYTSICIQKPTKSIINIWLRQIEELNQSSFIHLNELITPTSKIPRGIYHKNEILHTICRPETTTTTNSLLT